MAGGDMMGSSLWRAWPLEGHNSSPPA